MRAFTLLMLAMLALSGCLSDNPASPITDDGATQDDLDDDGILETYKVHGPVTGTMTAGASVAGNGGQFGGTTLDFSTPTGTTILFVEVRWEDPAFDLDLQLQTGANIGTTTWDYSTNEGAPGAPDSPHSLTVTGPGAAEWVAGVFSNGPAANVNYEIVATSFLGSGSVPAGYTAFA